MVKKSPYNLEVHIEDFTDFTENVIYVDAHFTNYINRFVIDEFAKGYKIYGNQIPETRVAIEAEITPDNIKIMGADGTSLRITINNIPCVKFKCANVIKQLQENYKNKVIIIGKAKQNNFMGVTTSQVMIEQIDIIPVIKNKEVLF